MSDWLEGQPSYEESLQQSQNDFEEPADQLWQRRITHKAQEIGLPDNRQLAEYLIKLEERLDDLDRSLDRLAEWTQRMR